MPHQVAVTVRAKVDPARLDDVRAVLIGMTGNGAGRPNVPFDELTGVHFARFALLPDATDLTGAALPASVVYMCDVDLPAERHIAELADRAGSGLDAVFGHCVGYPGAPGPAARIAWLRTHLVKNAAVYVHTVGRSVDQIRAEAQLRGAIEEFLDRPDAVSAGVTATEAHRRVLAFVGSRPELRWALRPPPGPGLPFRLREAAHLIAVPALGLLLAPVLVPVTVVVALRLLWLERRDVPDRVAPSADHLHELERYEDFLAQNPFTSIGLVKAGIVRRLALRSALFLLGYFLRHIYNRDNLAGVRTIHFARWLPVDRGRRAVFASNYDGSVESYMDDFIDRLALGLNFVFNHGNGYPATRWLVFGGASDELAFKRFLRRHQLPTQVWYSAYGQLSARNVDNNTRLRRGLSQSLTGSAAADWLALL
ncbi:MAG: hypothetical protein AUG49_14600 [Catenulispora sp. 13_1_20CM_3_70_7]|nr:MAG: hypothetical protein AUG49_14600 [Catenulispora sp. 13_1_20CM_3_70_7]